MMLGHLQVYSSYSFQRSTIVIEELCKKASHMNMEALALTDSNNMYGALEFYKACQKYHIKAIFGMEASVIIQNEIYPLLLLARDQIGYRDLVKIASHIGLSDEHAILLDALAIYKDHLFILSACQEGIIERLLLKELESEALKYMQLFKKLFHNSFYLCIQNHHNALQNQLNERMLALAKLERIPVCCSNEVRYLNRKDAFTLDLLEASLSGNTLTIDHQVVTDEKYLKSSYEMERDFSVEIIENTNQILTLCNVTIPSGELHLPKYPVPNNGSSKQYLLELCKVGLKKRFANKSIPRNYIERLKDELAVINKMNFDDYFLIVFDYVRFAKKNGILVGPGRGSAAGSLVSYVLGITNVDPIQYDLLFERFLNEERISMPDIDIDFQDDRRDEMFQYVTEKYGQEHVAQIVTFSTYGPKVAIKDLGKVMKVPLPKLENLAKLVPSGPRDKKSAKEVFETSARFQSIVSSDRALSLIMNSVFLVEKLPRNISTHAAGVILSNDSLNEIVPLVKGPSSWVVTQYSKDYIEDIGLLKMDFLGLKNLTMIDYILKDIEKNKHQTININSIPFNDKKTYDMIGKADTFGVFQLESQGMKNVLRQMKSDCFDDIVAAIALFRPGPMANIPTYIKRKFKQEQVEYPLPELEIILKPTYGVIIYQEQIMQIAQKIAGFSLAKADILRKAMSKKQTSLMKSMEDEFIQGAISNGFTKGDSDKVFQLIERFASYGFNKSHSVAYGIIAYQMAYLKANYPLEFFSAILSNSQSSDYSKIHCMQEGKKYGVSILPPSINYSTNRFSVEDNNIRYSLMAIKNVGYAGYQAIAKERENGLFKDLFDFVTRMDGKINSKMLESLIDAGVLDEFKLSRGTMKKNIDKIAEYVSLKNQLGIEEPPILEMVHDNRNVLLELEKNVLGIYLTMHPIALMKQKLNQRIIDVNLLDQYIKQKVTILISLQRCKIIVDKKGQEMCFIEGYDETGSIEGVVFASRYSNLKNVLAKGNTYLMEGRVDFRDRLSFMVDFARTIQ